MLKKIQKFFGGIGKIRIEREELFVSYTISSLEELTVIIEHFNSYPLITKKQADYLLFEQAFELMKCKKHLTLEGLHSLVMIKSSINKGLSEKLKDSFPNVVPGLRPKISLPKKIDPYWLCGFTEGDGCFGVEIYKSKSTKLNYSVTLRYSLTQNSRDHLLLSHLVVFFGCGKIKENPINNASYFYVSDLKNINNKILPQRSCLSLRDVFSKTPRFFKEYSLQGSKSLDFNDFHKVALLINEKRHLTIEGFELIKKIKNGMNKSRIYE